MNQEWYIPNRVLILRRLRVVAWSAFLAVWALPAAAQNVALVIDLLGQAKVIGRKQEAKLEILSEVAQRENIEIKRGARCTVLYPSSGEEYVLFGPATVLFGANGPEVLTGPRPRKKESVLSEELHYSLKPAKVAQAGYVMRGAPLARQIKLLALNDTKTLETTPSFRWQGPGPGLKYRFELTDALGRLLYASDLESTSLTLPSTLKLRKGVTYMWSVSARSAGGHRYQNSADFSIAPTALRKRARELRPSANAPVAERVLFAAWLEQKGLKDEAREYWRVLSVERPEDQALRGFARR